jgi:class 3 adenylate cyclase
MKQEKRPSPLATIEPRLRWLLPAALYASAWVDPSPETLTRAFGHLRTLRHVLYDYLPRQISENLPQPGEIQYTWREGTLMFTDLAGFTRLLEANAAYGRAGAEMLLGVLNEYFTAMIEIVSKAGGVLLEFTGDAMLAQFVSAQNHYDTVSAVRAALRMQRAMQLFACIETGQETLSLGMRIGLHTGRFLTADIGTPRRMEHVLLGNTVLQTKLSEGNSQVGRVNLTQAAYERVSDLFRFEGGAPGYKLVIDDLTDDQLGEYDIALSRRRLASALLLDRSVEGLMEELETVVNLVEPLASYVPRPILTMLVEHAGEAIAPEFPELSVLFVNMKGLPEALDGSQPGDEQIIVNNFSHVFALINAMVEAQGGVLKNVTYHHTGSDMLIYFGVPDSHTDDPLRAARTALYIRKTIEQFPPPLVGEVEVPLSCQIGVSRGPVFAAEIGEPRGRREFNVLGDTVNTAARLMSRADENQILVTEEVYQEIRHNYVCERLGEFSLKGKTKPVPLFALLAAESIRPPKHPNINQQRPIIARASSLIADEDLTPQERARIMDESDFERKLHTERAEGRTEGRETRERELVQSMLAKGMDVALIAEITGLSVDEIGG